MYKKGKVYKIKEARDNLSNLVADAPYKAGVIGKRGNPTAVIVDYEIAKKYLPKSYFDEKTLTPSAKLSEYALKLEVKKPSSTKTTDYATNIDSIVYGK